MPSSEQDAQNPTLPPLGDREKSDKYIYWLTNLLDQDKLAVTHTDLKKFDLGAMQDHYRIDLDHYEVEVSHSKHPDNNQDFYVMLFNNLKTIQDQTDQNSEYVAKVILAYIHLTATQFQKFKTSSDGYLERRRLEAEAQRFRAAVKPIDEILQNKEGLPIVSQTTNGSNHTDNNHLLTASSAGSFLN
ncbi:MAG: hypothetical protein Q7S88_01645 [Candidatus Daviesbacteria bacterium]|nr:hypothetical protein [Candidatus Daviesbacteria bacterium]